MTYQLTEGQLAEGRLTERRFEEILTIEEDLTDDPLEWLTSAALDGVLEARRGLAASARDRFAAANARPLFS